MTSRSCDLCGTSLCHMAGNLDKFFLGWYICLVNALQPNPDNGFLESTNPNSAECLTTETKLKIIELGFKYAEKHELPDLYVILKGLRVPRRTFYEHLQKDEKFAEAWKEVKDCAYDGLSHEISLKANTKGGVIANLAALKYLERGRFSDDPIVINQDSALLKGVFTKVIEAEVVERPSLISTPQPTDKPSDSK